MLGGGQIRDGNDFVGQYVELGNQKLRVKRLIAEGGYPLSPCHLSVKANPLRLLTKHWVHCTQWMRAVN